MKTEQRTIFEAIEEAKKKTPLPVQLPDFDGRTYSVKRDRKRLTSSMIRVYDTMRDGIWRTLKELAEEAQSTESGVSARLRDFRKTKFKIEFPDVVAVERRNLGDGLFCYRFVMHNNSNKE